MLSIWAIFGISLIYLAALFAIAYWGDQHAISGKPKAVIYSFSLGAYCTSWAFYGVATQAVNNGWWMAPTYAGSILAFLLAWRLQAKIALICKEQNLTSIADFISSRYGRSQRLAGMITLIAIVAVIPYIALQLKAVTNSVAVITQQPVAGEQSPFTDTTLYITLMMALFAILFGTRRVRSSEHNPGLVMAIAFESAIKLAAYLAIGLFVCYGLYDGWNDLFYRAALNPTIQQIPDHASPGYVYLTHVVLGALAMFCLPRQFHLGFIEQSNTSELKTARWLFPLYLIAINLFILPIAYAGVMTFDGMDVNTDTFVLALPMHENSALFTAIAYIGGFSAATSMVIITSVVLSVMVSNDLVTPFYLGKHPLLKQKDKLQPNTLITIRRLTIVVILILSYLYYRYVSTSGPLAHTGLIAFSLVAQFAPPLLLGLIWRKSNARAAQYSLATGTLLWVWTLLLPTMVLAVSPGSNLLTHGPLGINWLRPQAMFGLELDFITHGVVISLSANLLVFMFTSIFSKPGVAEQLQANRFLQTRNQGLKTRGEKSKLTNRDVFDLLSRFIGNRQSHALLCEVYQTEFPQWHQQATQQLEFKAERELSGVIGGASARMVMNAARQEKELPLEDVVEFVDEASQVLKFNRELLQSTIQNISQGISVVDKDLRIVAWNRRYLEMFDYPEGLIYVGKPVEDVIRYNAQRGLFGAEQEEDLVQKRLSYLRNGNSYKYQRFRNDGKVYEMQGSPLPGGGFVTTFTDITEYIHTQKALEEVRDNLELKVAQRTRDLNEARKIAEQATISKTRFFAAAGHDLLQPFNAATLFCSILREKAHDEELKELAGNITDSLVSAEELMTSILEITRLDSGTITTNITTFDLQDVTDSLANEYQMFARDKGLSFEYAQSHLIVTSDKKLLRRILQNLLANAVRYTEQGEIKLTTQIKQQHVEIAISDTGPGIAQEDMDTIFEEFHQLQQNRNERGLGLGLAITQRMCQVLHHPLEVQSEVGSGSTFCISVPLSQQQQLSQPRKEQQIVTADLTNLSVWILDNEPQVLKAMSSLLEQWGCQINQATSMATLAALKQHHSLPDLILADYQLDDGETGLHCCQQLIPTSVPVIINTANHDESIREAVLEAGFQFLHKPVKPAALKRLIKKLCR